MSIKVGDKVRFLNDVGDGVVVAFRGDNEVIVEHNTGFEIPIPRSECVLMQEAKSTSEKAQGTTPSTKIATISSPSSDKSIDRFTVSLAFAPADVESLQSGSVRLYIINDSEYSLFANIATFKNNESHKTLKCSTMRANEVLLIGEFQHNELPRLEQLSIQIIANKNIGEYLSQEPISRVVKTHLAKFSKRGCFSPCEILGCEAMVINLNSAESKSTSTVDFNLLNVKPKQSFKPSLKQQRDIPTTPEMVEVDLHIASLLDTTAGMSNADILEYQLDYMRSTIAQYERYRGLKLIFIHGKGDGVLRRAVIAELQRMGKGNRYQEASFKRYGYGALMVIM